MDGILKCMNRSYDLLTNLQARFMTTDTADAKRGYVQCQQYVCVRMCANWCAHVVCHVVPSCPGKWPTWKTKCLRDLRSVQRMMSHWITTYPALGLLGCCYICWFSQAPLQTISTLVYLPTWTWGTSRPLLVPPAPAPRRRRKRPRKRARSMPRMMRMSRRHWLAPAEPSRKWNRKLLRREPVKPKNSKSLDLTQLAGKACSRCAGTFDETICRIYLQCVGGASSKMCCCLLVCRFLSPAHVMLEILSFHVTGPAQVIWARPSLHSHKAQQWKGTKISKYLPQTKSHPLFWGDSESGSDIILDAWLQGVEEGVSWF